MSKVIPFTKKTNTDTTPHDKQQVDLNKVLADMQKETGLDFLKICTGDEKENKKLRFHYYQAGMSR